MLLQIMMHSGNHMPGRLRQFRPVNHPNELTFAPQATLDGVKIEKILLAKVIKK
jgi:hypothetical protein